MSELIDFLQKEDVKHFIKKHVSADVNQLILNPPSEFKERIKDIASQILARQKAKRKLDHWASNFDLVMPPAISIEQASSETTCAYKRKLISGDHLIDLTGGMGIDFLSMSESFGDSTYVEREQILCEVFQHNSKVLGNKSDVINEEATVFLSKLDSDRQSVIFLDPARRDTLKSKVFLIEDCSPNIIELLPLLREKAGVVLIKYSPLLDLHSIVNKIPNIKEIHVVSVKNECKELLLLVDFNFNELPTIHCVNLESNHPKYSFRMEEERLSAVEFRPLDQYLFGSNSSIMKAGAFNKIAVDFNLGKIAENTHLYTNDTPIDGFPGRIFKAIAPADKGNIKKYATNGKINVITRNYPLSANELKKKWKLKDGGDYFLIGFRDQINKARLIIAALVDS